MTGHPSEEEFDAWRDNPITRWVMRAALKAAEANREAWISASWDNGEADPALLGEYRTRADAYRALSETSYDKWLELNESDEEAAARLGSVE